MAHTGRPSKGKRKLVRLSALAPDVRAELVARADKASVPLSGYLADYLAVHVGRPDLVRHINNVGVRTVDRPAPSLAAHPATPATIVRVDEPVYQELQRLTTSAGMAAVATYVTAWCTNHVAEKPHAQIGHHQEELVGIA